MAVNVLITSNVTHISQLYQQSRSTVIDSSNIHLNNCKTVHSEVAVSRSRIFRLEILSHGGRFHIFNMFLLQNFNIDS